MPATPGRRRSRRTRGQGMVEFALVAPIAFLILLGLFVLSVVVLHQIQLSQAVRDGARAAAICGSQTGQANSPPTLPDSNLPCNGANIAAYINARVTQVDRGLANAALVKVLNSAGTQVGLTGSGSSSGAVVVNCSPNAYTVQVSISYAQPLYIPLVGAFFGTGGGNTRTISAVGEATCEQ